MFHPSLSPADPDPATPVDLKDEVEPKEEEEKLVGAALERFAIVPPRGRARIEVRLFLTQQHTGLLKDTRNVNPDHVPPCACRT